MLRKIVFIVTALVLALALGIGFLLATSVLSKQEIEEGILALVKNAPLREVGLERRAIRFEGRDAELVYVHVPKRAGAADAPPIVFVHPTPHSLATWTDVVFGGPSHAGLAGDFDIYLLDIVGHGMTRSTAAPYSFDRCSDWVGASLDALGLSNVTLVGQSYGGEFAWRLAVDRPDLVGRLVLMDSSGLPRQDDEWMSEEVKMREMSIATLGYALNARDRIAHALAPHFRGEVPADRVEEVFLVCAHADNWRAMVELARDENGTRAPDLARIACPALVIWGEEDVALRLDRHGRRLAAAIPGARLEVLSSCGHYPQEEQPARVVELLKIFAAP